MHLRQFGRKKYYFPAPHKIEDKGENKNDGIFCFSAEKLCNQEKYARNASSERSKSRQSANLNVTNFLIKTAIKIHNSKTTAKIWET